MSTKTHQQNKKVDPDVFKRALETYKQLTPLDEYLEEERRNREACDRALREKALAFEI